MNLSFKRTAFLLEESVVQEAQYRAEVKVIVCVFFKTLVCQSRHQVWFQQGTLKAAHLGSHQSIMCVCGFLKGEKLKSEEDDEDSDAEQIDEDDKDSEINDSDTYDDYIID